MGLTFKQYKIFDIAFMTIIVGVFELLIQFAGNKWFNSDFTLSITTTIVALTFMRWGAFAILPAMVGGLIDGIFSCISTGKAISVQICSIGTLGNLFCVFAIFFVKYVGKQKIHDSFILSETLVFIVFFSINVGRTIISLFFGGTVKYLVNYLFNDIMSLLFAFIAVFILRKRDGMFEDQKSYLFRVEREKKLKAEIAEREALAKNKIIINSTNNNEPPKELY